MSVYGFHLCMLQVYPGDHRTALAAALNHAADAADHPSVPQRCVWTSRGKIKQRSPLKGPV